MTMFALLPLLIWILSIVLAIYLIIWLFQIRNATRVTAEETKKMARTMNDIYQLLSEQQNNN